jgi:peptide/nickel transport system substrate-binding protein
VKRAALGIALAFAALPAGAAPLPYGGQVVIAYWETPTSLNPLTANFGISPMVTSAFTSSLISDNESGGDVPDLAERWDVSPDGLTWTFHLRSGVTFSDGSGLTSEDVRATFAAAIDPRGTARSETLIHLVKGLQVEGPSVFRIILKTPYSMLASLVQRPIVPAWAVQGSTAEKADYEKHPIGTGPFRLTQWTADRIVLDANLGYYRGRPHLDRIVFARFPDQELAWSALMKGTVDVVWDVAYDDYALVKDDKRFGAHTYLGGMCHALLFNVTDPLLGQPAIRKAISLAVDRRDLIDTVLSGGGAPTTGPFLPGTWAYNADPALQPFDPAKASRILGDLGWKDANGDWILEKDGKDLQFTVVIDDIDPLNEATVKRLRWQLLQVGIRMNVEVLPLEVIVQQRLLPGRFQAAIAQESTYENPDAVVSAFWDSSAIGALNLCRYRNPSVDSLSEKGRAETDPAKKAAIYQQVHAILANDAPAAFLYFRKTYLATSARLGGFLATPYGQFVISMGDWYIARQQ